MSCSSTLRISHLAYLVIAILLATSCGLFGNSRLPVPLPEFEAFKKKAQSGEPVVIAYFGGSITAGASTWPRTGINAIGEAYDYPSFHQNQHSWRALTYEWLRSNYESRPGQFRQVDAAIGGTPSILGTYRLQEDVLNEKPDLVFIEFAVNDNGKARMTEEHPDAAGSILRTISFIVEELRKHNPEIAIFMPLSTHRILESTSFSSWGRSLDLALEQSQLAAEMLRVPYVDLKEAFYANPSNPESGLYYDGGDDAGNYVHPSPVGHRAYAQSVKNTLEQVFLTGTFRFQTSKPRTSPARYPVSPTIVLPEQLSAYAPGWEVITPERPEAPSLQRRQQLVSGELGEALEITFKGTSIGFWCDSQSKGMMEVELNGQSMGLYANRVKTKGKYSGRFVDLSSSLNASELHRLRLIPVSSPDTPEPRILIYALTIDGTVLSY